MDGEREPTWDEAMAALEDAVPVEIIRSPRTVTVIYRDLGNGWFTARSPQIAGMNDACTNLKWLTETVRQRLAHFLDPAITVVESYE